MQKLWQWLEGKKTKIGAVLLMIGAVLAVAYQQVSVSDGLILFSAGVSLFGWADKANRHQAQILQALAAISTAKAAGVGGVLKELEPMAVGDLVAGVSAIAPAPSVGHTVTINVSAAPPATASLAAAQADLLRSAAKVVIIVALFLSLAAPRLHAQAHYRHHTAAVLNDLRATPGDVDKDLTKARLCDPSFHTGTVRNVTESQKKRICAAYGQASGCPGQGYEIDHLISIELGGANSDANLWPQPVDADGVIGFHTKDKVEDALHRAVCAGKISLPAAQKCIAGDWYGCAREKGILPGGKG